MRFCKIEMDVWHPMAQDKDAPRLKAQIDENLKRVYEQALEQEVPERFKALLAQLREKEARK